MIEDIQLHKIYHGGPYVNFVVGDSAVPKHLADEIYYYLDVSFFDPLFVHCFGKGSKNFDVCGPWTSFNNAEQKQIIMALRINQDRFESFKSYKDFLDLLVYYKLPPDVEYFKFINVDMKEEWLEIIEKLIRVNQDLIKIVQSCLDNNKVLWVLGV